MKKLLVVLSAVAMMFAFSATAFAYTDTADLDAASQDAITLTSTLGIFSGYDDGSFQPEGTLTRAEFATIVATAAGLDKSATYLMDTASTFSDVKTSVWYTGYINICESKGYIAGYPDGTFGPNDTITEQEVLTVLMRLLGYTDAELVGPWPTDFIIQATEMDLLDDIDFTGAADATREFAALLTATILVEDMVVYDEDEAEFVNSSVYGTLLEKSFDGATVEGTVNDIDEYDFEDDEITITVVTGYTSTTDDGGNTVKEPVTEKVIIDANTAIESGFNVFALEYLEVSIVAADGYALYISVESDVCYTSDVDEFTVLSSKSYNTIEIDGVEYKTTLTAEPATADIYTVVLDADGYVTAVEAGVYADYFGVVTEVEDYDVTYIDADGNSDTYDSEDVEDYFIIKNGEIIAWDELEELDVLVKIDNQDIYMVYSLDSGEITKAYSTTKLTIDGYTKSNVNIVDAEDYSVANDFGYDYVGTDASYFYFLETMEIVIVGDVEASTSTVYGIFTDATYGTTVDGFTTKEATYFATITIVNADGDTITYDVEDTDVVGYTGSGCDVEIADLGVLVELTINEDGEVSDVAAAEVDTTTKVTAYETTQKIALSETLTVSDDVVVYGISVDSDKDLVVTNLELADIMENFEATAISETGVITSGIQYIIEDGEIVAIVVANLGGTESDVKYGVVGTMAYLVDTATYGVMIDGVEYEYTLSNTGMYDSITNKLIVASGDVVVYTVSGDDIEDIAVVFDKDADTNIIITPSSLAGYYDDINDNSLLRVGTATATATVTGVYSTYITVELVNGGTTTSYDIYTEDAVVYTVEQDEKSVTADVDDIAKGDSVAIYYTADTDYDFYGTNGYGLVILIVEGE